MIKKKVTDPLKLEWDEKKGKVSRICKVCQKPFIAKHWKQTICKEEICKKYAFRYAHVKASYKRWLEVVEEAKKAVLKPTFSFDNNLLSKGGDNK